MLSSKEIYNENAKGFSSKGHVNNRIVPTQEQQSSQGQPLKRNSMETWL